MRSTIRIAIFVPTLLLLCSFNAQALGQLLIANNGSDAGLAQAWNMNPDDGTSSELWGTEAGIDVWGMAFDPAGQEIYASAGSRLYAGGLGDVPAFLGAITDGAGNNLTMPGLAWANGGLYGVRGVGDEGIFMIDTTTLVATMILDLPELEYDFGGLAFNPLDNLFYGSSDSLAADGVGLYSIDVFGNGNVALVTSYPEGEFDIDGLAIGNNVAYLVQDNSGETIHPFDLTSNAYLPNLTSPMTSSEVFSAAAFVTSPGAVTVTPESFSVVNGNFVSGGIAELASSDDADLSARRSNTDIQSRVFVEFKSTSALATPSGIEFTFEASVFARTKVVQTIDLYDYVAGAWETVDVRNATRFSDSVATVVPTGDLARFVEPGTGCLEARVRFQSPVARQQFTANIDQVSWTISQ